MKSLRNILKRTKKFNEIFKETETEKLDNDLNKLLVKYADYYDYDAEELMASVIWHMYSMCFERGKTEVSPFRNPAKAMKTWEDAYLKAMDICG